MKTILKLMTLTLVLGSCNMQNINVNSEKTTTVEIQNLANQDSTLYKAVDLNNKLYVVDSSNMVVKKVNYDDAPFKTGTLIFFLLSCLFFIAFISGVKN
jgi:TRAP-type mannitol/chloroaromatic compound transport system permease small subunit